MGFRILEYFCGKNMKMFWHIMLENPLNVGNPASWDHLLRSWITEMLREMYIGI